MVDLALKVLREPEVPEQQVGSRVREYLSSLSHWEYISLLKEAFEDKRDERMERMRLLRELGFTPREVYRYSRCRLNTPSMRYFIARRALLKKRRGLTAGYTFLDLMRMEDEVVGDMSTEEMIKELESGR